jgi:hypothetical protein
MLDFERPEEGMFPLGDQWISFDERQQELHANRTNSIRFTALGCLLLGTPEGRAKIYLCLSDLVVFGCCMCFFGLSR